MTEQSDGQADEQSESSGLLQRWSRRKIEVKAEATKDLQALKNLEEDNKLEKIPVENIVAREAKTDADMVPLDELTEESNYGDFLSPNVSEALRKLALRKLFHMPYLNVVDGLDDYAEDFTSFEALGDIIPQEMKRMLERERKKEEEKERLEAEQAANSDNVEPSESEETDEQESGAENNQLSAKETGVAAENAEPIDAEPLINPKDKVENENHK